MGKDEGKILRSLYHMELIQSKLIDIKIDLLKEFINRWGKMKGGY